MMWAMWSTEERGRWEGRERRGRKKERKGNPDRERQKEWVKTRKRGINRNRRNEIIKNVVCGQKGRKGKVTKVDSREIRRKETVTDSKGEKSVLVCYASTAEVMK